MFASLDVMLQLMVHQCQSVCGLSAVLSKLSRLEGSRHVLAERCESVVGLACVAVAVVAAAAVGLAAAGFAKEGCWKFV